MEANLHARIQGCAIESFTAESPHPPSTKPRRITRIPSHMLARSSMHIAGYALPDEDDAAVDIDGPSVPQR